MELVSTTKLNQLINLQKVYHLNYQLNDYTIIVCADKKSRFKVVINSESYQQSMGNIFIEYKLNNSDNIIFDIGEVKYPYCCLNPSSYKRVGFVDKTGLYQHAIFTKRFIIIPKNEKIEFYDLTTLELIKTIDHKPVDITFTSKYMVINKIYFYDYSINFIKKIGNIWLQLPFTVGNDSNFIEYINPSGIRWHCLVNDDLVITQDYESKEYFVNDIWNDVSVKLDGIPINVNKGFVYVVKDGQIECLKIKIDNPKCSLCKMNIDQNGTIILCNDPTICANCIASKG